MPNLTEFQRSLLTDEATVTVTAPCPSCSGTGHTQAFLWCRSCNRNYSDPSGSAALSAAKGDLMPCGCDWRHLAEDERCDECEGDGKQSAQLPLLALVEWALGRLKGEA